MGATTRTGFSQSKPVGKFANWDTQKATATRRQAIAEIEREANVRMKCYDRWVADGRMTDAEANDRMGAIVTAWHIMEDSDEGRRVQLEDSAP